VKLISASSCIILSQGNQTLSGDSDTGWLIVMILPGDRCMQTTTRVGPFHWNIRLAPSPMALNVHLKTGAHGLIHQLQQTLWRNLQQAAVPRHVAVYSVKIRTTSAQRTVIRDLCAADQKGMIITDNMPFSPSISKLRIKSGRHGVAGSGT